MVAVANEVTPERVVELLNEGFALFDDMTYVRHLKGQEEYGPVSFLDPDKDLVEWTMEELADAGNYIRYLFARLHIIRTIASQEFEYKEVTIRPAAFTPSKPRMDKESQ